MEPENSLPCSEKPTIETYSSQMTPVHTLIPYFFKICFNIILPSKPKSPKRLSG
jgi:hypothetical protein